MRIVFIGSVRFSARMLQKLLDMDADVVGICTLKESAFNADHVDLAPLAEAAGIPAIHASDINSPESISWIAALEPEVIFCLGWSRLIKQPLLSLAPLGVVGYHPAALPANRGRHPLIWALVLGLEQTGSTFFFMNEGADTGDILSQQMLPVGADDDAGTLYDRVSAIAAEQLAEIVPALENRSFRRAPQDERNANHWRKRSRLDGEIDWRMPAAGIHNLVRALRPPYPGAHFLLGGREIKIWRTEVVPERRRNLEPGKVLAVGDSGVVVKAGIDAIRLLDTDPSIEPGVGDYF